MLSSMANMIDNEGEFAILSSTQTAVNQNAWIASIKEKLASDAKYAKMKLVTVAYGEEKADVNAQKAKELVQAYPNLKGIIVPAGIGLPAAAEALSQSGDLGKIKISGLGAGHAGQPVHRDRQRAGRLVERREPRHPGLHHRRAVRPVQDRADDRHAPTTSPVSGSSPSATTAPCCWASRRS